MEGIFDKLNRRIPIKEIIEEIEKTCIRRALALTDGNKQHAADYLGLRRTTLCMKIKKYNLSSPGDKSSSC